MEVERDIVASVWAELAAIEPTRHCCRVAERAGLGAAARGRARSPGVGRLAVRLDDGSGASEGFDWTGVATHCRIAYLRGLMLAHGSLSITATGTHLELVVAELSLQNTKELVAALGFPAGTRLRRAGEC